MSESDRSYDLADLLRVMERLRDPDGGCPWDLEQSFQSIVPSTLEECYELAEAIEREDYPHVAEELGDVLFQVVFYAQMGKEQGLFDFAEVVSVLVDKLVRRHPHVFAAGDIEKRPDGSVDVAEVKRSWESIKARERSDKQQNGILDDVPNTLPALPRAQKLQKRAAGAGFDWPDSSGVMAKLREELSELEVALAEGDGQAAQSELGDLLFTCANMARHLGADAESTLRHASSRFERRFQAMEKAALDAGQSLADLNDLALDELWNRAKAQGL